MLGLTKHFLVKTGVSLLLSGGVLWLEYKLGGEYSTIGRLLAMKKLADEQRAKEAKEKNPIYVNNFQVV